MIYLTQGILLGLYAGVLPGPFQAFMLSQSLQHGWRRSLHLALVPLLTDLPVMLVLLTLLSQLPDWLLNLLRFGGGFYLLYLAWNTLKKVRGWTDTSDEAPAPPHGSFLQSILINYLNPNVYIFWGTVGVPIILAGLESSPFQGIGFIIGFYLTLVMVLSLSVIMTANGRLSIRMFNSISRFCRSVTSWANPTVPITLPSVSKMGDL